MAVFMAVAFICGVGCATKHIDEHIDSREFNHRQNKKSNTKN